MEPIAKAVPNTSGSPRVAREKADVCGMIAIAHRRTWIFCAIWRRECTVCRVGDGLFGNEEGSNRGITGSQRTGAMIRLRLVREILRRLA